VLSDYVDPDYGQMLPVEMEYRWATDVVSYGMVEQANQLWSRPKRRWTVKWAALKLAARDRFNEIFNRAAGRFRTFYWLDRDDYECGFADWSSTAVGGETTVQLQKTYHVGESESWTEDKTAIVPGATYAPTIRIDGSPLTEDTDYTLDDDTGIVNFAGGSAPYGALSAGEVVTADYRFYFVVRFDSDAIRDRMIAPGLYQPDFALLEVVA
jgi:uncharacterized protein (TIGR02217 family)